MQQNISQNQQQSHPQIANNNQQSQQNHPQNLLPKINSDINQPLKIYIIRGLLIGLSILIIFLAFAVPKVFTTLTNSDALKNSKDKNCNPSAFDNNNIVYCKNFTMAQPTIGLILRNLDPTNQFIILYLNIAMNNNQSNTFHIYQNIQIKAYAIRPLYVQTTNTTELHINKLLYNQTMYYQVKTAGVKPQPYDGPQINNNTNNLVSFKPVFAYDRSLIRINQQKGDYLIWVTFQTPQQVKDTFITIQAITVNYKFTYFSIILRAVYFIISLATAVIYLRRYFQLKIQDRTVQIKFIAIGSLFLLFFNDPFYAITILNQNPASVFFSSLFVVNMLIFLLFLWVFFLRRIRYEQNEKYTQLFVLKTSWQFYLFFIALYITCIVLFLQYAYYAYYNIPIVFQQNLSSMKVIPTIAVIVILLIIIVIYQIVIFMLICKRICSTQMVPIIWRHNSYLSIYPFILLIFIIFFGFGGAMPYNLSGYWILYGYSFINLFVWTLQYLYYVPFDQLDSNNNNNGMNNQNNSGINIGMEKGSINSDIQIQGNTNYQKAEQKTAQLDQQLSQS